jgi:hypothetical protein
MSRQSRSTDRVEFTSVRVHASTRKRLAKLVEQLVRGGWNSIGADRADSPGIGSVIDQGLTLVEERLKKTVR